MLVVRRVVLPAALLLLRLVGPVRSLHPKTRSRHGQRYDLQNLSKACPSLVPHIRPNEFTGEDTIDFAAPEAVFELNKALLVSYYKTDANSFSLPPGYLCPGVPSRANYIHHLNDLISSSSTSASDSKKSQEEGRGQREGKTVRVLDVGTGASGVYPLIGFAEYGWSFVGTDIDLKALENVKRIFSCSGTRAEVRVQASRDRILQGVIEGPLDKYAVSMCNPPFHASQKEAEDATARKWRNLKKKQESKRKTLNFGGTSAELWCQGGEMGFLSRMIDESTLYPNNVCWFTSLVSKEANIPRLLDKLDSVGAFECRQICMEAGQKSAHLLAWTFLDDAARRNHLTQ